MDNGKIAAAFVKAQKGFSPALKSATNPHFKSKYADLAACVEAVIDSLNAQGIALMQPCHESDSGVVVETVFIHESGEILSAGKLRVPAVKQDAQGYGSALTYARRYSLMAACGIAPEDDDGNAASKKPAIEKVNRIPASVGAWEKLNPEQQQEYQAKADEIVDWVVKQGSVEDAIIVYNDFLSLVHADEDQRVALWSRLPSNVRSAFKKHSDAKVAATNNPVAA